MFVCDGVVLRLNVTLVFECDGVVSRLNIISAFECHGVVSGLKVKFVFVTVVPHKSRQKCAGRKTSL